MIKCVKALPLRQLWHLNGLVLLWDRACSVRSLLERNAFEHIEHPNGRSPEKHNN